MSENCEIFEKKNRCWKKRAAGEVQLHRQRAIHENFANFRENCDF